MKYPSINIICLTANLKSDTIKEEYNDKKNVSVEVLDDKESWKEVCIYF